MFNAKFYSHNNRVQRRDASHVVDKYFHLLKWREDENILDIGTGDGGVLQDIIFSKLPKNFQKLTALDIDENMLKLAEDRFKHHPNVDFYCMDIASKPTPSELVENFDHIFSFYCLHYVKNQKEVVQTLFNMLKPGGEMLLTLAAEHACFDVFGHLAEEKKWCHGKETGLNRPSNNSVKDMEGFLKDAGFGRYTCDLVEIKSVKNYAEFLKFGTCVRPLIEKISKQDFESYKEDFLRELKKHEALRFECGNGKERSVHFAYKILVVFASKGEKCCIV